ncbi:hypothetical protein JTB14_024911 [Gonioctena quinquepunctata]|nr:hypothetical protein JTB14_024911 [Gonioctena quinquepunctata]
MKIAAFGNPLLDTTIFIEDDHLLKKYNLQEDGQKEITKSQMENLTSDISGYIQHNSAGGCAQNTLRVLQWLTRKKCEATMYGSVGNDKEADLLRELLHKDGVKTRYIVQNNLPTGKTIALVKGQNRSLVAYIGAAENLCLDDLLAEQDLNEVVNKCNFVYIEGFFLTNRTETAKYILDFCNKHDIIVAFNISGEYICDILPDTVRFFIENSDIVFGNRREFEAMRKIMKLKNVEELTHILVKNGKNRLDKYGKTLIITNGPKMGSCIYGGGRTFEFEVPSIPVKDFRDTTGAGDAFTGGFLAGLCENKSIEECSAIGSDASVQHVRTYPSYGPEDSQNASSPFSNENKHPASSPVSEENEHRAETISTPTAEENPPIYEDISDESKDEPTPNSMDEEGSMSSIDSEEEKDKGVESQTKYLEIRKKIYKK